MVFLPGDHVLDADVTVVNVSWLIMYAESSAGNERATIVCSGPVGLNFTNMVNFKIQSLAFTSCSRTYTFPLQVLNSILTSTFGEQFARPSLPNTGYTLLLQSTQDAELVDCFFYGNIGIALVVLNSSIIAKNNNFTHNYCESSKCNIFGGGISAISSSLTFIGNTTFIANYAIVAGAGIFMFNSTLHSTGNFHFMNNSNVAIPEIGNLLSTVGAMFAHTSLLCFSGTNNFTKNSAQVLTGDCGGAICALINTSLSFTGTNNFINNSVQSGSNSRGGAIHAYGNTSLSFNGTNNFVNNSAQSEYYSEGGAISAYVNTSLSFTGTNNFINNSVQSGSNSRGGAIHAYGNTSLSFNGTNNFVNNSAAQSEYYSEGGAISAYINCMLSITGTSNFSTNYATEGGAIFSLDNNNLIFDGNINFTNNGLSAKETISYGGGMYLHTSYLHIMPDTTVYWDNNHASFGGAIFVADQTNPMSYCTQIGNRNTIECFYQLSGRDLSNNTRLIFKNNSAELEGDALCGGVIDNCRQNSYPSGDVFDTIFDIEYDNTNSKIYPNPLRICPCGDSRPNCDSYITRTVYPGETFHLSVIASGRQNRKVSATVGSRIRAENSELQGSQYTQQTNSNCTPLNFTVFTLLNSVLLELYEEGYCGTFGDILNIHLTINQTCPPGFNISEMSKSCVCEKRLQRFTNINCNITTRNVTRDSGQQFWVGYVHEHESHGNASDGLILHQLCPFDYCTSESVDFPLNNTDVQCAHNRSGLLCGACRTNYSLVLGTSYCKQCTNSYLALLILFAVMGVALVFFLFVCKVTVATGALSGLVFYANIVRVNRTIFLPVESTDPISVFIAWLNLDFGIEICFYDGMDAYSQTWLQFMFPAYLWVLVGLVILVSHFSHRFAKLLGNNPVSVLATLILLSYTKILRTLIAAINFTHLEYPTDNRTVWLYDANINYLSGKHIPLFIVAVLVFLFLFIPYTLLLVFDQWLQAISHLRLFSWVNKLKPFMDSYHAPYKAKHRYWPGLLLVLRFVLLLVLAVEFSPQQDRTSINLLTILVVAGILQLWAWISGGVYRNWCLDALEGSFSLNLIILASATSYVNSSEGDQLAVGHTSGSIALITFIGILTYHIFQQLKNTKLWEKVPKLNPKFKSLNIKQAVNDLISRPEHPCEDTQNKTVTHTEIDLHELRSPLNLVSTK